MLTACRGDPESLLRFLLLDYFYGITSERRRVEEVRMHLAYRWFTRLGLEQEVPCHSTFSKNRHGRFRQPGIFLEMFEEIVRRLIEPGNPVQNAFIESFNGKMRDEFLNEHWFGTLVEARQTIEAWRRDYNEVRPHSSLRNPIPIEFTSCGATLRSPTAPCEMHRGQKQ